MDQTQLIQHAEAWGSSPPPSPWLCVGKGPRVTASGLGLPVFCLLPAPGPLEEGPSPKSRTPYRGPSIMAFTSCL